MSKALVILSGGQDSTTCLFWAKKRFEEVMAVTFNYGQRHEIEIEASYMIAKFAKVERELINIPQVLKGSSPLVDPSAQVEHYVDFTKLPGGLENTFVPARNMLFLTLAANRAYINNCDAIVIGVSQEDFGGYPDCRRPFIDLMEQAINEGLDRKIKIETPLIYMTKKETVWLAQELGEECWEALAYSHTCYEGTFPPCGKCHACHLRTKGFQLAGFQDPLELRAKQ